MEALLLVGSIVAGHGPDRAAARRPLHAAYPPQWRHDELFAWISFGKVGSTTFRNLLRARAARLGWEHPKDVCHAKDRHRYRHASELTCTTLPAGAVVQTDYGYCELLHAAAPHRSCQYITIVREPISRMVSSYDHFCRQCREGGKRCVSKERQMDGRLRNEEAKRLNNGTLVGACQIMNTCPKMDFLDFAAMEGNKYVNAFANPIHMTSPAWRNISNDASNDANSSGNSSCSITHVWGIKPGGAATSSAVISRSDFERACDAVKKLTLVIDTYHLSDTGHAALASLLRDPLVVDKSGTVPRANVKVNMGLTKRLANVHKKSHKVFEPNESQIASLHQNALRWDLKLWSECLSHRIA